MIKKPADRRADDGLAVSPHIPCNTQPRGDIISITRESLCHIQRVLRNLDVLSTERDAGQWVRKRRRSILLREFVIVTHTIIEGHPICDSPGILSEKRDR